MSSFSKFNVSLMNTELPEYETVCHFQMMGEKTTQLILEQSTQHIEIPFSLKLRASL